MGYTHYFKALQPNAELAADAEALVNASGISIKGWDGECEPHFMPDIIDFNGDARFGEDHETFRLAAGDYDFNFCKTARKAYDQVVSALLMRAIITEAEGFENIASDGGYRDWENSGAFELYAKVFGNIPPDDWEKVSNVLGWD